MYTCSIAADIKHRQLNKWPLCREVFKEVGWYAIRAWHIVHIDLRKRLLKFTGSKVSSICCLGVVRVDGVRLRWSMIAFSESLSFLRRMIFTNSWMTVEAFVRLLAYTLPLYNSDLNVGRDSFPDERRTVGRACLASWHLKILSKCLCKVASVDSSVSLVISRVVSSNSFRLVLKSLRNFMRLWNDLITMIKKRHQIMTLLYYIMESTVDSYEHY